MANDMRPVIVSSNRYADIEPYCVALHKEAPKRWGGIMPWNFPQNAPQDVEEAFLREQYPAVEVQVQGFRFLKQIWYCIALNNFQNRIPYTTNAWFEQKGPAFMNDPALATYLLHPDACATTFFEAPDIELYGTDFLDVAVKAIQYEIRGLQDFEELTVTPAAPVASSAGELALRKESPLTVATELQAPQDTASNDRAQSRSPKEITPISTTSTTVLKPTATEFSSNNTPVQSMATLEPGFQSRSFSGEASSMPVRVPNNRARGPGGKRNNFHDRPSFQSPQAFHDSRFPSSQAYQQPGQQMQALPMPQFATQGPNTWALPFEPNHSAPQRPYQNAQAPPGFESHPPHFSANVPNTFTPNRPPHTYGPHQITERAFNHGDARNFGSHSSHGGYDQGPARSNMKRRESNASYGGKGGSVRGRGRGRGGRNSHSSIDENFYGVRHPLGTANGPLAFGKSFDDHQYDTSKGRNTDKHGSWNMSKRDENTAPYSRTSDQFPHGSIQILHNPRRASHTQAVPGTMQRPLNAPSFTSTGQYPSGLVLPDSRDKFSNARGGLPLPEYGCQKNAIGPLCTYAKKLVVFGIPAEPVPLTEIYECFGKYGPIHNINGPMPTEGTKGLYSRTYVTFHDAESARKCIQNPPAYLRDWRLDVEVAREFWEQTHEKFQPRSDFGWSAHDLTNVAPPSMHYVQTSAINPAPPLQAHRHDHSVLRPSETFSKEGVSAHTTPTMSGPGTPKGKKKKNNNKNKKPRKDNIEQAFAENAQKTRPALSPIPDNSSSVAETIVTRHTTPVKRADSLRPGSVVSTQPEQDATNDKTDDVVAEVSVVDASASKSTASAIEAKPMAAASVDLVAEETADTQSKSEDEPIDDSFHTASATPREELPTSIDAKIEPATAAIVEGQAQTVSLPTLLSTSKDSSSDSSLECAELSSQAEVAGASSSKAAQKTSIPVLPKTRSSVVLPQLDTSKASADTSTSPENGDEAPLTATQERTISGNSDRPSAPFVTAPNTPISPLLGQIGSGQVQSRKEARAKEAAKAKGPAQTESFSLFSKTKKTKRKPTEGREKSRIPTAHLEIPHDFPVRKPSRILKVAPVIEQPKVTSASSEQVETAESSPNVVTAVEPDENATESIPSNETDKAGDVLKTGTAAKVEPPVVPSILRRISNKLTGASQNTADGKDGPQPEEPSLPDIVLDKPEAPDSLAADGTSTAVNTTEPSKKSKKKKMKKPKTKDDQAKAVVVEMSHLAPSNETSMPLYQFEGTEAGSTASGSTVSQDLKQSNSSSPEKVKTPRRLGSDNHLVQASPPRRVVSRPKPTAKKSSDSSDSPKKATPSSGTEVAQQVPRTLAEISEMCAKSDVCNIITLPPGHTFEGASLVETNETQEKMWIIFVRPDPIEAAKTRMQSMDQQEKDIKEKKKLAMEGGRVLGEVESKGEDEVTDDGVRVAEVVEPVE